MAGFAMLVARMPRMRAPLDAMQGELPVPSRSRPDMRKSSDRSTIDGSKRANGKLEFPPAESSGYLVRDAHRAFQRLLERRIAAYGVTRGQWYFLRVLWNEDGLSQRELSARVGMMEPTTVIALQSMERSGLIRRVRAAEDRRRSQVWLTAKAKRLRRRLLGVARRITEEAEAGIKREDLARFQRAVALMTANLDRIRE
jgi:MarR family transcriptional regulator, organic hydroperoxide resistance regulator